MSGTDEQIKDAYARLEGALAPPLDVTERVQRRVAVRRRRRRVAMAGGIATVAVATVGTAALLSGGSEPSGDRTAVDQPPEPTSTLVMTRPDGSTYAFSDLTVSCDPPLANGDEPVTDPAPGHIWAYSPIDFDGSLDSEEDVTVTAPFVMIQGILSELQDERTFELPIYGQGGASPEPVNVFIADTEGGKYGNEVSSSASGSGTVRVLEASCDPVPVLRVAVDATLGSEESKQSLDLAGELR